MRPCEDCDRTFAHGGALAAHRRACHQPSTPTVRQAWRAMLDADQEAFRLGAAWERAIPGTDFEDPQLTAEYDAALEASHEAHVAWEAALARVTAGEDRAA